LSSTCARSEISAIQRIPCPDTVTVFITGPGFYKAVAAAPAGISVATKLLYIYTCT
jgi:hypothetical protein